MNMINKILVVSLLFSINTLALRSESYDYKKLSETNDVDKLIKTFHTLRLNALAVSEEKKRPDLFLKAQYWTSQNPHLRKHAEEFFRNTPHVVQTYGERLRMIDVLHYLTAEWSLRLLFEEVMIDRKGQEFDGYEGPTTAEHLSQMLLDTGGGAPFVRNDTRAAYKILKMELSDISISPHANINSELLDNLRKWYSKNNHRLDQVVLETWGKHAVLNKDMDYESNSSNASEIDESNPEEKLNSLKQEEAKQDDKSYKNEKNNTPGKNKILTIIFVAVAFVLIFIGLLFRKSIKAKPN